MQEAKHSAKSIVLAPVLVADDRPASGRTETGRVPLSTPTEATDAPMFALRMLLIEVTLIPMRRGMRSAMRISSFHKLSTLLAPVHLPSGDG